MHGPGHGDYPFSNLSPFQRDILFASFLLGKTYSTKEYEAELPKAIARILIKIAADTKHRGHAYFLVMVAQLFDPKISTHQFAGYPEPFIRAPRRKVRLVMTTKGHPKDRDIDEAQTAKAIMKRWDVGERQARRLKAKERQRKRT